MILAMEKEELSELRSLVADYYEPSPRDSLDWKDKLRFSLKEGNSGGRKEKAHLATDKEPFAKFGLYKLDPKQVQTILALRLQ